MKGLLLKDFLNARKQIRTLAIFAVFYAALGIVMKATTFGSVLILVFVINLSISAFAYDDQARWDGYALTMPVTRRDVVVARYLYTVVIMVLTLILGIGINVISALVANVPFGTEEILVSYVLISLTLLAMALLLPLIFKFGTEKSRMLMILVFAIPFAGFMVFTSVVDISALLANEGLVMALVYAALPVAAIAFVLSGFVSIGIYKKKEF